MTRRLVGLMGRKGSDVGIWIARPDGDILTDPNDNLQLSLSIYSEQLLMFGTSAVPAVVPLGLSQKPYVFLWSVGTIETDVGVLAGLQRPYPVYLSDSSKVAYATVTPQSMTLTGGATTAIYQVFRRSGV